MQDIIKQDKEDDNYIKDAIDEESIYNLLVKKAKSKMIIYLKFENFRKIEKDIQEKILLDIFENRIHRFDILFDFEKQPYYKKIGDIDDLVQGLSAVINFCVCRNLSRESIKNQIIDLTGIDGDLATELAKKVDDEFDSIRLAFITDSIMELRKNTI